MGQEISQQNKCITSRRHQQQPHPQQQHSFPQQQKFQHSDFNNNSPTNFSGPPVQKTYNNNANAKHKELIYTSSSISNASSTDDEYYRQRQKYNLAKQTYEKVKISKQLGSRKSLDSHSSTSDYQSSAFATAEELYHDIKGKHQRKNSQSTDSGIYYSSCHCTPTRFSSAASVTSGGSTSVVSSKSSKSLQKQKEYLDHHLYIKSYLDILEEDQKASAQYKVAKPGGIRNYTPKILADVALSTSAPVTNGFAKQRSKIKDDPWI